MSDRIAARGDRPSPMRTLPIVRHPRRTRYPNLSPTRRPAVATDASLWPAWTDEDRWAIAEEFPLFRAQRGGGGA